MVHSPIVHSFLIDQRPARPIDPIWDALYIWVVMVRLKSFDVGYVVWTSQMYLCWKSLSYFGFHFCW